MFEDLELPDMERKILREVDVRPDRQAQGLPPGRRPGPARQAPHRQGAHPAQDRDPAACADAAPPPPLAAPSDERATSASRSARDDLTYKRLVEDTREESNAVVLCIMDTSGSMDT